MRNVIIMGAGGRDFHNFNVAFRNDPDTRVVAFTATQIPGIDDRMYPAALAGELYPDGIPIRPENELSQLVRGHHVDEVILAYSDLKHETVMHKASLVLAAGADFRLMGPNSTMLRSIKPWPDRSLVNGRPLGARCSSPPRCLIAVPIAMNSAMSWPQS